MSSDSPINAYSIRVEYKFSRGHASACVWVLQQPVVVVVVVVVVVLVLVASYSINAILLAHPTISSLALPYRKACELVKFPLAGVWDSIYSVAIV